MTNYSIKLKYLVMIKEKRNTAEIIQDLMDEYHIDTDTAYQIHDSLRDKEQYLGG